MKKKEIAVLSQRRFDSFKGRLSGSRVYKGLSEAVKKIHIVVEKKKFYVLKLLMKNRLFYP